MMEPLTVPLTLIDAFLLAEMPMSSLFWTWPSLLASRKNATRLPLAAWRKGLLSLKPVTGL